MSHKIQHAAKEALKRSSVDVLHCGKHDFADIVVPLEAEAAAGLVKSDRAGDQVDVPGGWGVLVIFDRDED